MGRTNHERRNLEDKMRRDEESAGTVVGGESPTWTPVQQQRLRRIARRHAATNSFCLSVLRQIEAGRTVSPKQGAALRKIDAEQTARERRKSDEADS